MNYLDLKPVELLIWQVMDGNVLQGLQPGFFLIEPNDAREWLLKSDRGCFFPFALTFVLGRGNRPLYVEDKLVVEMEPMRGLRL